MSDLAFRYKILWIAVFYFTQGFPFGIVKGVLPVYFRLGGVSLTDIGLMSLLGLPWTFKFLWAPLVDRYGERRQWTTGCLLVMAAIMALMPTLPVAEPSILLWGLLLIFTMASATQDVAIDAHTIGLVGPGEEGDANGMRATAYRLALIASGGGLVIFAGTGQWKQAFVLGAVILAGLAILVWRSPRPRLVPTEERCFIAPMKRWLMQPGALGLFAFVLLYKLGDAAMGEMVKPFWLDRGFGPAEIGLVSTSLGIAATIAGALLGGRLTDRWGIFHAVWILGLTQALSNLGYAAVAWLALPAPTAVIESWSPAALAAVVGDPARLAIYGASLVESFTGGLGVAAFLALLMRVCDKEHAATQYALLTALFALSRDLAGAASGWATETLGYAVYFGLTFLLAFPAYALLPAVRARLRHIEAARGTAGEAEVAAAG